MDEVCAYLELAAELLEIIVAIRTLSLPANNSKRSGGSTEEDVGDDSEITRGSNTGYETRETDA